MILLVSGETNSKRIRYVILFIYFIITSIQIDIDIDIGLLRTPLMMRIFACPEIKGQLKTLIWIMLNKLLLTHILLHLMLVLSFFKKWVGKERVLANMNKVSLSFSITFTSPLV